MTNLEHLVENGLDALENGHNYNEWLEQMKKDINWNCCERLTIDDLWEICQYVFYVWVADRKTENSSEIPNNCEHITEDGVTCAKYPACDDCLDNPLNKVKGSERLVKGKEQADVTDINVGKNEEQMESTATANHFYGREGESR